MTTFLIVVHVIVCFVLILVILLQAGRGQGLTSSSFGSGNVQTLFGTKAADFLTKATAVSAIGFLLTCIALDLLEVRKSRSLFKGPAATSRIDVNQIKKALEKVKAEKEQQGQKAAADVPNPTDAAKTQPPAAAAAAETNPQPKP